MSDNYTMALGQLKRLTKYLTSKGEDLQLYHELIQKQMENKFIVRAANASRTDVLPPPSASRSYEE